jgi:hypothetical protein
MLLQPFAPQERESIEKRKKKKFFQAKEKNFKEREREIVK